MSRRHPVYPTLAELFAGKPKVRLPIPLSAAERHALDAIARRRRVSRAYLIREAVDAFLRKQKEDSR